MKRISSSVMSFTAALLGGLAVVAVLQLNSVAKETNPPAKLNIQSNPVSRETRGTTSYAPIIKRAAPSVVNIYSTRTIPVRRMQMHPFFDDPAFREWFGVPEEAPESPNNRRGPRGRSEPETYNHKEQGLGSGVVVSSDGYILTAAHVVDGADPDGVKVALPSGGEQYTARIIGVDTPTDIAVLKIDAKELPAVALTDSDKLEVGDMVLAIGNPFGVGQTVTMGMVSALGRGNFPFGRITEYENFIQTDAPINRGNSGGALIDAEGRLVGINTAIFSPSGGNAGIGFAVPINLARSVMERLIEDGKVIRGYLGVHIQTLTPALVDGFNLPDQRGALVTDVSSGSPGAKAGLRSGDVIRQVSGRPVTDSSQLRLMISLTRPGTKVDLKVLRSEPGKQPSERTISATLGSLDEDRVASRGRARDAQEEEPAPADDALAGVEVSDLDPGTRRELRLPSDTSGALVTNVEPGSNAEEAGLRRGDVIQEINRQAVSNASEAAEIVKKAASPTLMLRVKRGAGSFYLSVDNTKQG